MKIVHIGYKYGLNDTGGAAIAATRLHLALLAAGDESYYICVHQCQEGPNVVILPRMGGILSCRGRALFFFLTKISRCIGRLTSYRCSIPLNIVPLFGLERYLTEINPDVIHIQWLNADVMSFEQVGRLRKRFPQTRIVLNLHDLFWIHAIGAHSHGDTRYMTGYLPENSSKLERWLILRKKNALSALVPNVCFLCPSEWVANCVRNSIVGKGMEVFSVSNITSSSFSFNQRLLKKNNVFTILFGASGGRGNAGKGFGDLLLSLKLLPSEVKSKSRLLVFGESASDVVYEGIPCHFLGAVQDPDWMAEIYHSADVFAFPSREETQGMTKVEALLCGVPVVAFDRTACSESIDQGKIGWIAPDGDYAQFAAGILWAYNEWVSGVLPSRRKVIIGETARDLFSAEKILTQIRLIYGHAMG